MLRFAPQPGLAVAFTSANLAIPTTWLATRSGSVIGVKQIIRMPTWTMCTFCLLCWKPNAAKQINSLGHNLKMFRIYTASVTTKMVDYATILYRAISKFINDPMRVTKLSILIDMTITQRSFSSNPGPTLVAATLVNLSPESLLKCRHMFYDTRN